VKVDLREVESLEGLLDSLGKRGVARAIRGSVNAAAFSTRKVAVDSFDQKFILRAARFVKGSVRVDKSTSLDEGNQSSEVGSIQGFMKKTEFGFISKPTLLNSSSVPTGSAAGQPGAKVRTRKVRTSMRRSTLKKLRQARSILPGATKKRRQAAIFNAVSKRKIGRFFVLPVSRGRVLLRAKGGLSRKGRLNVSTIYWLPTVPMVTPPVPWLAPAISVVAPRLPKIFAREMQKQLLFLRKSHRI